MDGQDYKGNIKSYFEGEKLCIHTYAAAKNGHSPQVDYINTAEIVDNECRMTLIDKVSGLSGARIFKRYPYYKINNVSRKTIYLSTYSMHDFVYQVAAMRKELAPGIQTFEASSPEAEEEQCYCSVTARDTEAGTEEKTLSFTIRAFQSYTLTMEMFDNGTAA